jgi:hypothetical protein
MEEVNVEWEWNASNIDLSQVSSISDGGWGLTLKPEGLERAYSSAALVDTVTFVAVLRDDRSSVVGVIQRNITASRPPVCHRHPEQGQPCLSVSTQSLRLNFQ